MALGPGKYGDHCDALRERLHAQLVIVAVIGGDKGPGFSVSGPIELQLRLPEVLESIAAQLREDRARIISRAH